MKCKGIQLSILVGDSALEEYQEEQERENSVTSWIASSEGEEFSIKVDNQLVQSITAVVYIDGRNMSRVFVNGKSCRCIRGAVTTATSLRPFIFTPIKLSDDDALIHQDSVNLEAIGTITITIQRAVEKATGEFIPGGLDNKDIGVIHERNKKAGVHCVALGKEKPMTNPQGTVSVHWIDPIGQPFGVFTYRYRAKDILRAQGIAPLSPRATSACNAGTSSDKTQAGQRTASKRQREQSSSADPNVKDESDESDVENVEDVDALKAQLEDIQAKLLKAKGKEKRKRVKREPSPIRLQTSGDVIDLTSD